MVYYMMLNHYWIQTPLMAAYNYLLGTFSMIQVKQSYL